MRLSKTRQRSQAACTLYGHHKDLPTIIQSIQSGSELRIQSRRITRNSANDRNSFDVVSCDCSVSTLGDEFSNDGNLLFLPESPVPSHQHRWKQISEGDLRDADMPPIGPRRSTACFDDSVSFQEGNDTTSRRQRSILSSDFEASEATDINEDFSNNIQVTKTVVEELIEDLRLEQGQRQALGFTPKPAGRTPSNDLNSTATSANRRRTFELSSRFPSEDSLETISPPTKERSFGLNGSRDGLNGSREALKTVDTPPSMAIRRKSCQHFHDSSTDEECEHDCDGDDDSYAISPTSGNQRIPSDRPPELAKRLMSPSPAHGNGVSLDSFAIGLLDIEATQQE